MVKQIEVFYLFASKHSEEKVVEILQKTWRKISKTGQEAALKLAVSEKGKEPIGKAISDGTE